MYEVDGQRIGERTDRLEKWFRETPDTAIQQGRRLADKTLEVRDMPVSGTLSVDPTDGRVLTTAIVRHGVAWRRIRLSSGSKPTADS